MTKEKIIKLYIADLNNLVADSDANRNRIMDLEDELEALKQGQSLTSTDVSQQRELLNAFVEEFVEAWEDGMGVDTDLYRKAKSLL